MQPAGATERKTLAKREFLFQCTSAAIAIKRGHDDSQHTAPRLAAVAQYQHQAWQAAMCDGGGGGGGRGGGRGNMAIWMSNMDNKTRFTEVAGQHLSHSYFFGLLEPRPSHHSPVPASSCCQPALPFCSIDDGSFIVRVRAMPVNVLPTPHSTQTAAPHRPQRTGIAQKS